MKTLTLTISALILIILASHVALSYESNSYALKTFVIEGNKEHTNPYNTKDNVKAYHSNIKTFIIGQKPSGKSQLIGLKQGSKCARARNRIYQQRDEEVERCIKKLTKNWKRTYSKTSYEKEWGKLDTLYSDKEGWITTKTFQEKEKDFYGYDEDKHSKLRMHLRDKFLDGEELC